MTAIRSITEHDVARTIFTHTRRIIIVEPEVFHYARVEKDGHVALRAMLAHQFTAIRRAPGHTDETVFVTGYPIDRAHNDAHPVDPEHTGENTFCAVVPIYEIPRLVADALVNPLDESCGNSTPHHTGNTA